MQIVHVPNASATRCASQMSLSNNDIILARFGHHSESLLSSFIPLIPLQHIVSEVAAVQKVGTCEEVHPVGFGAPHCAVVPPGDR